MHQSAKNLSIWVIECAGGYIEFLQNFVGLKLFKKTGKKSNVTSKYKGMVQANLQLVNKISQKRYRGIFIWSCRVGHTL